MANFINFSDMENQRLCYERQIEELKSENSILRSKLSQFELVNDASLSNISLNISNIPEKSKLNIEHVFDYVENGLIGLHVLSGSGTVQWANQKGKWLNSLL